MNDSAAGQKWEVKFHGKFSMASKKGLALSTCVSVVHVPRCKNQDIIGKAVVTCGSSGARCAFVHAQVAHPYKCEWQERLLDFSVDMPLPHACERRES